MLTENEKKVLRYLALHKSKFPSINNVARDCKITPNGTYKILKKFEAEGILKFKQIANIKSYYLDFANTTSQHIMEFALTQKIPDEQIALVNELQPLREITDICIISNKDALFILDKNYEKYKQELSKIKIKINSTTKTRQDLINSIKDDKTKTLIEKGIVLWGQDILTKIIKNAN